jgi:hypothetical protein
VTWVKLDDEFPENEKVASISDRAFRLHVSALCYCGRLLTDGVLDDRGQRVSLAVSAATKRHVRELVDAGLWLERGKDFAIKDYLDFNPTRKKVLEERARNAERQQRLRDQRNGTRTA